MKLLILVALFALASAKHEKYIGWKTYFVAPNSTEQGQLLGALRRTFELDFLSIPTLEREGLVLVKPEHQYGFTKTLEQVDIAHWVHMKNFKEQLDYEDDVIAARRQSFARSGRKELPYDNYQTLEAIYEYLDDVAARFPEKATLVNGGPTAEGRFIKYLKISTTNFEDLSKPVIFIDGGIHAREWISIPVVTWAVKKLLEDVTEPDLLDRFDWIIVPVANPDGYSFSHTNDRMWRKTRSLVPPNTPACPGVDGNRNYDFFWGTVGTSTNPCADDYGGPGPLSEVETSLIADLLNEHLARVALYLTMHSLGSVILYPWGHDGTLSNNALALHTVGIAMADTINDNKISYFPRYIVGNAALVMFYGASGASEDYAHWIGVPLSYTYELPGLWHGFHLAPQYIQQVAHETWLGIGTGARRAGDLFRK